MKKVALFVILNSIACFAQISGAGQLGCPGSSVTGSAWNSGTAGNTVQTLYGPGSASAVTVVIDQTTTITGGAVTFLGDFGDGNFVNVPAFPLTMINPTNNTALANPYTLVASTNQPFFIPMVGMNRLQLKLSTALTGSGTITPFTTLWCGSVTLPNATMNEAQVGGTAVDTNSGTKSAGTQRVVLATDQPQLTNKLLVTPDSVALPANQSVNEAQINGTTPDMNSGTKSSGTQRVILATDQPQLTNKLLVTPDANVKVNVVGNAGANLDAATGAAPPANALLDAGLGSGATGGFLVGIAVGDTYKAINISTATTTLIVTGVSGRQVRITAQNMLTALANNVAWIEGTGATCGTGTAGMAGGTTAASGYNFAANGGLTQGTGVGTVLQTNTTGDSVCLVTSAATQLSGGIEYAIY